jgi:urease
MGDANASIPSVQPFIGRPMWGSYPASAARNSVAFVSQVSLDTGKYASYGLAKRGIAVRGCRSVTKKDMKWNDVTPKMTVDPESFQVHADGELATVAAADRLPLARAYNLF